MIGHSSSPTLITATPDLLRALERVGGFVTRTLGISHALVLMRDGDEGPLRGVASSGSMARPVSEVVIPVTSGGLCGRVARERAPVEAPDVAAEPGVAEGLEWLGARALLGLPLSVRDELVAVVVLADARGPRRFPPEAIELAQGAVGQLALSVENARLYASLQRSHEELAATRAEMVKRERLAALGELSAIVAHEVRNPLGALVNALAALRTRKTSESEAQLLVSMMSEEADRLNRIVGDLLDFARPRTPELEAEDVGRLIEESVDAARASLRPESPPVEFTVDLPLALPRAPLDRRLFRQALLNVTLNAADAMPSGGVVHVRAAQEERAGRAFVRVDVEDTGVGMAPERITRIFEPFFSTKAQGTGLGLAVVKRIVDEHDGELEVDSRVGQGTRITFRFPLLVEGARA